MLEKYHELFIMWIPMLYAFMTSRGVQEVPDILKMGRRVELEFVKTRPAFW